MGFGGAVRADAGGVYGGGRGVWSTLELLAGGGAACLCLCTCSTRLFFDSALYTF